MRDAAALLVLAFTALALTPAASAIGADAAASTTLAANPAAPVPPTLVPSGEAVPPAPVPALADAVDALQSGDLPIDGATIPAVSVAVSASVDSSAGAGIGVRAGDPDPGSGDAAPFTPSLADADPLVVAAVAAPLAIVAVGVAAGGFGLRGWTAVGPWSARTLRTALAFASLGLFSRIERGHLLDNPVRARVHDAVAQDPGLTISEVQTRAGIAWGTTVHHLRRLEDNGMLVSVTRRANRHYFVANSPAAAQRSAIAMLMHPTARRIATLVALQPGIDQTGLCQALGLNGPAASKHLGQFRGQGLVASQRVGRRTVHHPTPGLQAALGLLDPTPTAWPNAPLVALSTTQPPLVAA